MSSEIDILDFILNNLQKIVLPEELINIELSISRFELEALLRVDRIQNVTMSNLAQRMSVPMSTATGIVDRLVGKGLLIRDRSEEDRRVVTVDFSEKGRDLLNQIYKHQQSFMNRIRKILTDEEFEIALKLIGKVIEGLQKEENGARVTKAQERKTIKVE